MNSSALLRLLQLSSPALPIGAFAYSQGLEGAASAGWVTDEASASDWILGLLARAVGTLDAPVLCRLHAAWLCDDATAVHRWSGFLLASRGSAELQSEDLRLGGALARVLSGLGLADATRLTAGTPAPYAALFALAAVRWEIPAEAAVSAHLFTWCETQVQAGLRLLPLGQSAGQRILDAAIGAIPAVVAHALTLCDDDIGATAPAQAIASAHHETQYSRLFRS